MRFQRVVIPESNAKPRSDLTEAREQKPITLYLASLRMQIARREQELQGLDGVKRILEDSFVVSDILEYLTKKTSPTLERLAKDLVLGKKVVKKALCLLLRRGKIRARKGHRFVTYKLV